MLSSVLMLSPAFRSLRFSFSCSTKCQYPQRVVVVLIFGLRGCFRIFRFVKTVRALQMSSSSSTPRNRERGGRCRRGAYCSKQRANEEQATASGSPLSTKIEGDNVDGGTGQKSVVAVKHGGRAPQTLALRRWTVCTPTVLSASTTRRIDSHTTLNMVWYDVTVHLGALVI